MDFRKKIKDLCQEQGITQKELAHRLGISDISLNKTLRGEYPQLQSLEKIAGVLHVSLSDLFTEPSKDTILCPHCGGRIHITKA